MTIEEIRTTFIQGTGYFEDTIKKFLKRTEAAHENENARVQRVLDEERKTIQKIVETKGKVIQNNELRGYDFKGRLIKQYEKGELGKRIDTFA